MKRFIPLLLTLAVAVAAVAWTADAFQVNRLGRGYFKTYGATTLTNTVTAYHTVDGWFVDKNDLSFHVKQTVTSGSGSTLFTIEAANDVGAASPSWVTVPFIDGHPDSIRTSLTWAAAANKVLTVVATEGRYRLKFAHSGTGVDVVTTNLLVK